MNKKKKSKKIEIFLIIIDIIALICFGVFYGPYTYVSDRLITTAMTTMSHKYLARMMYSEKYINERLEANVTIEAPGYTNASAIKIASNADTGIYDSIYDEQILKRDEGNDLYKVIEVSGSSWNGWIVAIYDPSRVKAVLTSNLSKGSLTTTMAKENDAIIAINGGGFERASNKVYPLGVYIQDGETLYNPCKEAQIVGFNKENILVLGYMNATQAILDGVRDAMEFGPFLIVNGEAATFKGDGGYGKRSRTAIAQRQDGTVLFVVIDGTVGSTGISMPDLTDLLVQYKAYNAANLDGGGSSTLVINGELVNSPKGWGYSGERYNVNAWILK